MTLKYMWGWKEILYLFVFVFIIVPVTIESIFYKYALNLLGNSLYAGVLMGFIMAVVFTFLVYVFCIKRYNLSWARYWDSEAFMERLLVDICSGYFFDCS